MTPEFEKARDEFAGDTTHTNQDWVDGIKHGANWAYEWLITEEHGLSELIHAVEVNVMLQQKHKAKADKLAEALEQITKYNFRGNGPSGCDSHCINHPCGPCMGLPNEKWVAKQALKEYKGES